MLVQVDLFPANLEEEAQSLEKMMYAKLNDGVYAAGGRGARGGSQGSMRARHDSVADELRSTEPTGGQLWCRLLLPSLARRHPLHAIYVARGEKCLVHSIQDTF